MRPYLFSLVFLYLHSVESVQGGWISRFSWPHSKISARRRSPVLPALEEISTAVEKFIQVGHPRKRRARGMTREELTIFRLMHTRITWLGSFLVKINAFSKPSTHDVDLCKSRVPGLEAIRLFVSMLPYTRRDFPKLRAAFPTSRPATVLSTFIGSGVRYRVRENVPFQTIKDEHGPAYNVKYFFKQREDELTLLDAQLVTNIIKSELEIHKLVGVDSRDAVECRFHLKTVRDILVHPGQQPCVSCPGGCLLNFFLLYSRAKTTLMHLIGNVETHWDHEVRQRAKLIGLNLSLQLVQVVQQIRLKRLVLPRFSPEYIHIDESGTLAVYPQYPPQPETTLHYSASWPRSDPSMNSTDTAFTLLYIWCPMEMKAAFPSPSTVTVEELSAAISFQTCSSLPRAVRMLIAEILSLNGDLGEVSSSTAYIMVQSLLQQELE